MNRTPHQISRRNFLQTAATAATAAHFAPRSLFAQAAAAPVAPVVAQGRANAANAKITTQKLRRNVSVLMGSGGNIAVLASKEGKLLVDAGFSTSRPQITEALAAINADPIRILVNTHWHYDHTDGNEWLHSVGAGIWAHENTLARMSTTQLIKDFNATIPPSPAGALPTTLFSTEQVINGEGNTVHLTHYDPAHTDTDISVYFAEADIVHCGDTFFNGAYPFIDYSTGGSIDGMIAATKRNVALGTPSTIVIPGHGAIGDKTQLSAYLDMLVATREKVAAIKKQGKSLEETVAAKPTASFDAQWFKGIVNPDLYTKLLYEGV
jgi:glyoxylase-like metal-dependent hydrolase (beta-lactamase superfamily II)